LGGGDGDLVLALRGPCGGAVEGARGNVGGEEGNGSKGEIAGGFDGRAEMLAIEALDGGAGGDGEGGIPFEEGGDAIGEQSEGSGDASNGIVDGGRAVERDNDVVDVVDDLGGVAAEEESGAEEGGADILRAEETAEAEKVGMHEGFAAGENDPLDAEAGDVGGVAFKVGGGDFLSGIGFPDVAHDAAAVAAAVRVEDQYGEGIENGIHILTGLPARLKWGPRTAAVAA